MCVNVQNNQHCLCDERNPIMQNFSSSVFIQFFHKWLIVQPNKNLHTFLWKFLQFFILRWGWNSLTLLCSVPVFVTQISLPDGFEILLFLLFSTNFWGWKKRIQGGETTSDVDDEMLSHEKFIMCKESNKKSCKQAKSNVNFCKSLCLSHLTWASCTLFHHRNASGGGINVKNYSWVSSHLARVTTQTQMIATVYIWYSFFIFKLNRQPTSNAFFFSIYIAIIMAGGGSSEQRKRMKNLFLRTWKQCTFSKLFCC